MHKFQEIAYSLGKPVFDLYYAGSEIGVVALDTDNEWMITDPEGFKVFLAGVPSTSENVKAVELLNMYCTALLPNVSSGDA